VTIAVETDTPLQHVHGGFTGVLVLAEPAPGDERDHGLTESALVAAVDGVGTTTAGSLLREVHLLAG
jgi:hypothetical protein